MDKNNQEESDELFVKMRFEVLKITRDRNSTIDKFGRFKRKKVKHKVLDNETSTYKEEESWSLWYDAVEDSEEYQNVIVDVEKDVDEELGGEKYFGICHQYWRIKRRILKEKYGIDWKSPGEMNPLCRFD